MAEFVARQSREHPPLLAWAEPDPLYVDTEMQTGRRESFVPLCAGEPSWPRDTSLAEARLFWREAALHVVASDDGGCRWARIQESACNSGSNGIERSEFDILLLKDAARFGVTADWPAIKGLRAIEYRQQGRLVAWRLTLAEQENSDG